MNTYVALFRGINVGGKNRIPMKELKEIVETLGYKDVETYIQSGNVLFNSSSSEAKDFPHAVGKAFQKRVGFQPDIFVLSANELDRAIQANPFPKAEKQSTCLHLYFLSDIPKELNLEGVRSPSEQFELIGKVFYLYAPDGIGRSKLVSRLEKLLGVKATGRNWKSIATLQRMLKSCI